LPAQFARAAEVIVLMHIWRAVDFTTRMPDQVFQGVGRTGLFTVPAAVEKVSRMILAWILLNKFGCVGLFYAFIISSPLQSLVAWPLMVAFVIAPAARRLADPDQSANHGDLHIRHSPHRGFANVAGRRAHA
jgi:Na+-driven multidrug efflux pump